MTEVIDRRPLATRGLAVSGMAARALARTGITPNQISTVGMVFGLASGVALGATALVADPWWRVLFFAGAALTQFRLLCNMLDGMVALEQQSSSRLGELFNEIPDRVSDSATLIGLGFALGGNVELGFAAALLAMFTAYIRAMGKAAGAPQQFCGPMSKPQRMFTVTAVAAWCALTPLAWQPTVQLWAPLGLPALALLLICAGAAVASVRRLLRVAKSLREAA
jgi:phosphatidylglycerophosphate synthase